MFVDPAVQTCYPTNQTVAYQNQYTRVICEYPSHTLSYCKACALSASVSLSVRPLVPHFAWGPNLYHYPTSGVPYAFPTYYSLAPAGPRPDQIWTPRQPTPDSKPNSASRHSSTTPPSPQCLIEHLTFPRLRSSRPLARVLRSP